MHAAALPGRRQELGSAADARRLGRHEETQRVHADELADPGVADLRDVRPLTVQRDAHKLGPRAAPGQHLHLNREIVHGLEAPDQLADLLGENRPVIHHGEFDHVVLAARGRPASWNPTVFYTRLEVPSNTTTVCVRPSAKAGTTLL
jgi:hypothetical protein